MHTKQTILILGTGYTGKVIAARLAEENFHVLLCDKDHNNTIAMVNELKAFSQNCDVEAMECTFDGAWEADIIIFTMPLNEQKEVAAIIKNVITQKILVSIIDSKFSDTCGQFGQLQELLPNTKIVYVLTDTGMATSISFNNGDGAIMIAGTDDEAVETVSAMMESIRIKISRVSNLSAFASVK